MVMANSICITQFVFCDRSFMLEHSDLHAENLNRISHCRDISVQYDNLLSIYLLFAQCFVVIKLFTDRHL
jgi:hypothetical protein